MSEPNLYLDGRVAVHAGDCAEVVHSLADNSIDAVVTDPPYALVSIVKRFGKTALADETDTSDRSRKGADGYARLAKGFMGKAWDNGSTAFSVDFWAEVWRVLKPGAHVVAFGGTRTYHRLACAIEDAGFEIRDRIEFDHDSEMEYRLFEGSLNDEQRNQFGKLFRERGAGSLSWKYGSGFPKSHNVSAKVDRCLCALPLAAPLQAAFPSGSVLQSEMCWNGEASESDGQAMFDVRKGVASKGSVTGEQEQGVLDEMWSGADLTFENRATVISQPTNRSSVRGLREGDSTASISYQKDSGAGLLPSMQRSSSRRGMGEAWPQGSGGDYAGGQDSSDGAFERSNKPILEGRRDLSAPQGELRPSQIRAMSSGACDDGADGWLCDGASPRDGSMDQAPAHANGVRPPQGSRASEQSEIELGTLAGQQEPQERRAWHHCQRCGKPIVPVGLGSALKPACEPIVLARKPLSEPSLAANVLRWGTGALNIDACRVEGNDEIQPFGSPKKSSAGIMNGTGESRPQFSPNTLGRWPANLVIDDSQEVRDAFPTVGDAHAPNNEGSIRSNAVYGIDGRGRSFHPGFNDSGSAARFFFSAKADADDRLGSKHPTVKPVDLMQWLCRLVCPPNGTILDPFSGTGTTGEAAWRGGFNAVLVEREPEYLADIARRMALAAEGQMTRKHESAKARNAGKPDDHGPLFAPTIRAAE